MTIISQCETNPDYNGTWVEDLIKEELKDLSYPDLLNWIEYVINRVFEPDDESIANAMNSKYISEMTIIVKGHKVKLTKLNANYYG